MNAMKNTLLILTKPKEFFQKHKDVSWVIGLVLIIVFGFLSTLILPKDTSKLDISQSLIGVLYVVQGIMAVLSVLVTVVLMTIFTWLVQKIFKGKLSFGTTFKYNIVLYIPIAIGMIWSALVLALHLPAILNLNIVGGAMNSGAHSILFNLGRRIDVFSLWSTVILFFLFSTGLGLDKKKSVVATVLVWLLVNLPPAIMFN